ncbi:MAG: hypothetical protein LUE16_09940 [Lachnospiraceae bacterium]|nr:hypothetical protein [Lachnospiraceae bacterium]
MWKKSGVIKTRKFQVLVLIEFLLLCYGICGLLRGEQSLYTMDTLSIELSGGEVLQEEGYYVDGSAGVSGDWLKAGGFSLTPGVYRLLCTYKTEETASTIEIRADGAPFRTLLSNEIPLYTGISSESFELYVTGNLDGEDGLEIVVTYYGSQTMTVTGLEIIRTTMGSRILLFFVFLGSLLVNSLVMLYEYTKRNRLRKEWILVWLGIPALAMASSVPLMVDYVINGADLIFHLNRIEFLAESLSQGVFPTRIESGWLYGHGYANSIFYCDTFLLFPAILRLIGFPVHFAYGAYVFVVNLATAAVAYLSFGRMFQNKYVGMVGSMLYTLSPYRLYNIYNRSAVGEYTAMIFLPVVVLGFYLLLGRTDEENKNHPWDWLVLVVGFSGVIQSHALSFEIAVAFSTLLCVVCIKRVFRRQTFPGLCKAVLGTILVNL